MKLKVGHNNRLQYTDHDSYNTVDYEFRFFHWINLLNIRINNNKVVYMT